MREAKSKVSIRSWLSILAIVLVFIVAMIDRNGINLMVDPLKSSLGINDFQMSLLQGPAFAAFFLLGSLLSGWLIDKYSNRWLIFLGAILWSLATVLSGFSDSFLLMVVARSLVGLGVSVLQPAGWNIVTKLFPQNQLATALSVLTAGTQVGVALSYLTTGYLIAAADDDLFSELSFLGSHHPWQWVYIIMGLVGIAIAFVVFIIPNVKRGSEKSRIQSGNLLAFIKENRAFLICHFSGFGLISIMVNGAAAWAPTYLIRILHVDIKEVGLLLGLVTVPLGVIGVIVAGFLVDRSFKSGSLDAHLKHFSIRVFIIGVLGFIGLSLIGVTVVSALVVFGIIQFIQPFSGVAGASLQISTPIEFRSKITSAFIMFYNALGMIVGPSLVAAIGKYLGDANLGVAISINYLALGFAAGVLLWLGKKYAVQSYLRYGVATEVGLNNI